MHCYKCVSDAQKCIFFGLFYFLKAFVKIMDSQLSLSIAFMLADAVHYGTSESVLYNFPPVSDIISKSFLLAGFLLLTQ